MQAERFPHLTWRAVVAARAPFGGGLSPSWAGRVALVCLLEGCASAPRKDSAAGLVVRRAVLDEAAPECLSEQKLRAAVRARLGGDPWAVVALQGRRLELQLSTISGLVRARASLVDRRGAILGQRTLTTTLDQCRALEEALALSISMALRADKPTGLSRPPEKERARHHQASRLGLRKRSAVVTPRGPRLIVAADATLQLGTAPGPSGGVRAQVSLRWPHLSLGLEGRYDAPARGELERGAIATTLGGACVLGCGHYRMFFGCGTFTAAALHASGQELVDARRQTFPYIGPGARAGVQVQITRHVAVRTQAEVVVPFERISLVDSRRGVPLWRNPPVAGSFGLGLVGAFL